MPKEERPIFLDSSVLPPDNAALAHCLIHHIASTAVCATRVSDYVFLVGEECVFNYSQAPPTVLTNLIYACIKDLGPGEELGTIATIQTFELLENNDKDEMNLNGDGMNDNGEDRDDESNNLCISMGSFGVPHSKITGMSN